jgi:hypothetical protein
MKKNFILIIFLNHLFFLFAEEKAFDFYYGQTQISKYISLEIKITTERYSKTLIPSYELVLLRKMSVLVKELEFWVDYDYGQVTSYHDRTLFVLDKEQLEEFNRYGKLIFYSKKFEQIARESNAVKQDVFIYRDPDAEDVFGIFKRLVIDL